MSGSIVIKLTELKLEESEDDIGASCNYDYLLINTTDYTTIAELE